MIKLRERGGGGFSPKKKFQMRNIYIVLFSDNSQNFTPNFTAFDGVDVFFLNKLFWRKMTLHVHVVCVLHLNFKYQANCSSTLSYERKIYSRNCFCLFYFSPCLSLCCLRQLKMINLTFCF